MGIDSILTVLREESRSNMTSASDIMMLLKLNSRDKWFMADDTHMYILIDDVLSKIGYINKYDTEFIQQDKMRELNEFVHQKGYKGPPFRLGQYVSDITIIAICRSLNTIRSNLYKDFVIENVRECFIKPRTVGLFGGAPTSSIQYNNQVMDFNHIVYNHKDQFNINLDINNQVVH